MDYFNTQLYFKINNDVKNKIKAYSKKIGQPLQETVDDIFRKVLKNEKYDLPKKIRKREILIED